LALFLSYYSTFVGFCLHLGRSYPRVISYYACFIVYPHFVDPDPHYVDLSPSLRRPITLIM